MRVLALATALAGGTMTAEAGDLRTKGGKAGTPDLWMRLLAWAQDWNEGFVGRFELLLRLDEMVSATEKEGSSIDPNGTSGVKSVNGVPINSAPSPGEPL